MGLASMLHCTVSGPRCTPDAQRRHRRSACAGRTTHGGV